MIKFNNSEEFNLKVLTQEMRINFAIILLSTLSIEEQDKIMKRYESQGGYKSIGAWYKFILENISTSLDKR